MPSHKLVKITKLVLDNSKNLNVAQYIRRVYIALIAKVVYNKPEQEGR